MTEDEIPNEGDYEHPDWFDWATARDLHRVIPIAQKESNGRATFALSALELYDGGYGLLRYLVSYESLSQDSYEGAIEPEVLICVDSGLLLENQLVSYNAVRGEAQGLLEVAGLPNSGEVEVEIARLNLRDFGDMQEDSVINLLEGSLIFRFSL